MVLTVLVIFGVYFNKQGILTCIPMVLYNPIIVLEGIYLFFIFSRIQFVSPFINRLARSVLPVYMIQNVVLKNAPVEKIVAGNTIQMSIGLLALILIIYFLGTVLGTIYDKCIQLVIKA